jgi:hypothetical protein
VPEALDYVPLLKLANQVYAWQSSVNPYLARPTQLWLRVALLHQWEM